MLNPTGYRRLGRRGMLAATGALLAAPSIVRAQGQNGVALVIGNSKYLWEASLPNVRRDAPDVAKRFQALGLKTEMLENLGRDALLQAIDRFGAASRGAKLAAFYFAGHGVSWDKQSFIVPVDADLSNPSMVTALVRIPSIIASTKEAANRFLVFDSCRNNPADGWRQQETRNQARSDAADSVASAATAPNTLVLLSTAPGGFALDGPAGENSPFASALLSQLDGASVDLQALPGMLRRTLLTGTDCRQMVWDQNSYAAPFTLKGLGKAGPKTDSSRIIELPNAYAFAAKNKLVLPPGLIALRSIDGSTQARKVGAYEHVSKYAVGASSSALGPAVLAILAVDRDGMAQVVTAGKDYRTGAGVRWSFRPAPIIRDRLEIQAIDELSLSDWTWRDADSGIYTASTKYERTYLTTYPFKRLDS
jgi:hypothetical protein